MLLVKGEKSTSIKSSENLLGKFILFDFINITYIILIFKTNGERSCGNSEWNTLILWNKKTFSRLDTPH